MRNGLRESTRGVWSGDEDLGDESLQQLFDVYKSRRASVMCIGTAKRLKRISQDVTKVLNEITDDLKFLTCGVVSANEAYSKALEANTSSEQTMMELSWNAVGFEELVKKALALQNDLNALLDGDKSLKLLVLKSELLKYLRALFSKKRVAATHLLVFMIADELRNQKPYAAIPVRFLPYKSLTDRKLRELEIQVENAMRAAGMTVVGNRIYE